MATLFRNKVIKNVGTVPVEITSISPTSRATVVGLSATNLTESFVFISIYIEDDTSVSGYYLKDTILPANTSLRAVNQGEKLILASNNRLLVSSSIDDSVDIILSYVEIT
jgi:hypothetical protein